MGFTNNRVQFEPRFWTAMGTAFTEGISESQRASLAPKDMAAWQNFISKVIEYLQEGYNGARSTQKAINMDD